MKGIVLFYDKVDTEKAAKMEELGLPTPKLGTIKREVYFSPEFVSVAYRFDKGIVTFISNVEYVFEYNDELWKQLKEYLGD